MRCKTCHYSLANLVEHRCPECGRPFDPNDVDTFEHRKRRSWPSLLCIALIGACCWICVAIKQFKDHMTPTHEIPLFWQMADAVLDGLVSAFWIVLLLSIGFALGRWRPRSYGFRKTRRLLGGRPRLR